MASTLLITADNRDGNYVIKNFFERAIVFDDPRRPDLINFYVQTVRNLHSKTKKTIVHENKNHLRVSKKNFRHKNFTSSRKISPCQVPTPGYRSVRICNCEFFISSPTGNDLEFSKVKYLEDGSENIKRASIGAGVSSGIGQQYQMVKFSHTVPGDILRGKEASITVRRVYFVRIMENAANYKLDLMDVHCIDGSTKTVEKCQVYVVATTAHQPILRFMRNGRVLLDDEMSAPSFFELNEEWWNEVAINEEIKSRAQRTERHINLKLRRGLQMDPLGWQGPNIGSDLDGFPQGGEQAQHLESLGRYRTGLADGYGDLWVDRPQQELTAFIQKQAEEERIIKIAGMKDRWKDVKKIVRGQEVLTWTHESQSEKTTLTHPTYNEKEFNERLDVGNYDEFDTEADIDFEEAMETETQMNIDSS